jgi:flagellar basal-body rod modification protein FlgD
MSFVSTYNPTDFRIESTTSSGSKDRFEDLGVEDFLKLMVAELQNQDPLNPSDNKDMLNQLNSMRQIVSSDKLSSSMESIMLGQSVATASNLLGKTVKGMNQLGEETTGTVDRVVFEDGNPKVYVGIHALRLESITEIVDKPTE